MLQPKSNRGEEHPDFKWGDKKAVGRTDKSVSFYESFTFEDIEYRLFDCAYFQIHGQCETSIGKLIRMYETSSGEKKVKVLWFFRPMDIRSYLRDYVPQWDELFLACGDDPGVYNINDVVRVSYLFFLIDDDMVTLYVRFCLFFCWCRIRSWGNAVLYAYQMTEGTHYQQEGS